MPSSDSEYDGPIFHERVRELVDAVDAQWLVLSGWPGDGRRRFLKRWLAEVGTRVPVEDEATLDTALEQSEASGRFVTLTGSGLDSALEPLLTAEQGYDVAVVGWPTWRLEETEARELLDRAGLELEISAGRLLELTGGWLRPFELCVESLREGSTPSDIGAEELEDSLSAFVRYRVAASDLRLARTPSPRRPLGPLVESARRWCLGEPRFARAERDDWRDWWTFDLLGSPRLVHHRRAQPASAVHAPFRRLLEFLALLALAPQRSCPRETVLERLWEPDERRRALRNLHPTVSHLRRLLGPEGRHRIVLEEGTYRWRGDNQLLVDVDVFRRGTLPDASLEESEAAWSAYRGDLMEGHDAMWVVEERAQLREAYLLLLERLGRAYLESQETERAEDAFKTLLVQDPLREDIAVELMHLYRARGRRDRVRDLYQRLRASVESELGSEPLPETTATYRELLR